jgi:pimeloyl-ACP methyl ester carboxylesterase
MKRRSRHVAGLAAAGAALAAVTAGLAERTAVAARRGPGPSRPDPHEQDAAMAADVGTTDTPAGLRAHELVLLHGQPGSPADWQLVSGRLPAPLHAIAADRPGYGSSRLPAAGFAANARAVLDDLDSRGITRAVLVGHSYGGGVALSAPAPAGARGGPPH